jgi:hypothetical protein
MENIWLENRKESSQVKNDEFVYRSSFPIFLFEYMANESIE